MDEGKRTLRKHQPYSRIYGYGSDGRPYVAAEQPGRHHEIDGEKRKMFQIPEVPDPAVDVELTRGKGAVVILVATGPADNTVVPAVDAVAQTEVLELLNGNGGETWVDEVVAVSFRPADEDVAGKLVDTVAFEDVKAAPVGSAVEVEFGPVPVTRVPVNTKEEVLLVRGNGAELVLAVDTLVVNEVDVLVVKVTEVFVFTETDKTV